MMNNKISAVTVISAIQKLPVLLKSARYVPNQSLSVILQRLIKRMSVLSSASSSPLLIETIARRAVDECQQPGQKVNPTVEKFRNLWSWDKEKLIDTLVILWKEIEK